MNPYAEEEEAQIAALQSELEATKSALKVYQIYGTRCSMLTAELDGERTLNYDLIGQYRAHCVECGKEILALRATIDELRTEVALWKERWTEEAMDKNDALTSENIALHAIIKELNGKQ